MPQDLLKSMKKNDLPTQGDSLALYNNSKKVQDYYKSRNYQNKTNSFNTKKINPENVSQLLDLEFRDFQNINKKGIIVPKGNIRDNVKNMPESMYRKVIDKNKFLQREKQKYILDTRSPMQLYDKRIAPTQKSVFENKISNDPMYGDIVAIETYDPVLVKPVNMLTPEEKAIRLKRYGKNSGIQPQLQPTSNPSPLSLMKKPEIVVKKQNNYEGEDVMLPVPFGGGSSFIGVKKKDGNVEYVKPEDFKRMGVPAYAQEFILKQLAKNEK